MKFDYRLLGDNDNTVVNNIEYIKGLYESQKTKVKYERYIEDLLLQDYVRTVRKNLSRYDYINIFKDAQNELGERLKKNRKNLKTLKSFIVSDFLNNDTAFKITHIISCGWETYSWAIELEGYGKTIRIDIPIMKNINTENIQHARHGKFAFSAKTGDNSWTLIHSSYEISDIAVAIKEYFTKSIDSLE